MVTCNLGALADGATATVSIVVTALAGRGAIIINTAIVVGNETDPNTANNTATASTRVR